MMRIKDFNYEYKKEFGKTENGIAYILEFYNTDGNYCHTKIGYTKDLNRVLNRYRHDACYSKVLVRTIIYVKAPEFKEIAKSLLHYYFTNRLYLNLTEYAPNKFFYPTLDIMSLGGFFRDWDKYNKFIDNIAYFYEN